MEATQPNLDVKKPIGNGVSAPVYQEGEAQIATVKDADVKNSSTDLNISNSEENRSAQYKYPSRTQDTGIMADDQK